MVKVVVGDIFESQAQTLVNTVNCVGVMGKGIALEFKKRFPEMFADYQARCARNEVRVGYPYLYKSLVPPWVLNFPTKRHWRSLSRVKDITKGLDYLVQHYREWGITSLAVPPLGCGQGGLEWRVMGPILYGALSRMDIPVELYVPAGTPDWQLDADFLGSLSSPTRGRNRSEETMEFNPAWLVLVEILKRLEEEPYHWPIGRVTFQKIVYVSTREGIPTGLQFGRSSYGPFSPGLKALMTRLVNMGLICEKPLGRMIEVRVGPAYKDVRTKYQAQIEQWGGVIDRIVSLFMRMKTNQAEIVATVLYVNSELMERTGEKPTERDVLNEVMLWKQRRRPPLDENEVAVAIRNLAALGWAQVRASMNLRLYGE